MRFIILTVLSASTYHPCLEAADEPLQPMWQNASVSVGAVRIAAARVRKKWPTEELVDGQTLVRIDNNRLEVADADSLDVLWMEELDSEKRFRFINSNNDTILLLVESPDEEFEAKNTLTLTQRNLKDGQKLPDLVFPATEQGAERVTLIDSLVEGNAVYFLTASSSGPSHSPEPIQYRVSKMLAGKEVWGRNFKSRGDLGSPGAFIVGSWGPGRDGKRAKSIVAMRDQILIQAGPLEDLLALSRQDGAIKWSVSAIWEYRRGFIGPSVWSYYLGRYGVDDSDVELATKTLDEIRKQNQDPNSNEKIDEDYFLSLQKQIENAKGKSQEKAGWVFAGPVVVDTVVDGNAIQRIFVVAAVSENGQWPNYLAKANVFELTSEGAVIGMVELPRLLKRNDYHASDGRLVWRTQAGNLAELYPTKNTLPHSGGPDTFIRFAWHRVDLPDRKARIRQGARHDPIHFFDNRVLFVKEGGYIMERTDGKMTFPITISHLASMVESSVEVSIPFNGKARLPSSNYGGNGDGWTIYQHYLFMLKEINVLNDRLALTFEYENERRLIEFHMDDILKAID